MHIKCLNGVTLQLGNHSQTRYFFLAHKNPSTGNYLLLFICWLIGFIGTQTLWANAIAFVCPLELTTKNRLLHKIKSQNMKTLSCPSPGIFIPLSSLLDAGVYYACHWRVKPWCNVVGITDYFLSITKTHFMRWNPYIILLAGPSSHGLSGHMP